MKLELEHGLWYCFFYVYFGLFYGCHFAVKLCRMLCIIVHFVMDIVGEKDFYVEIMRKLLKN